MTVSTTIYTHNFSSIGGVLYAFTIPFPIESADDIQVYTRGSGALLKNKIDYTLANVGLGGADSFQLTLTDHAVTATYDVHRRTPRTQVSGIASGAPVANIEKALDKVAISGQEGLFVTVDGYDANGVLVRKIASPISSQDAANLGYAQSAKTGNSSDSRALPPLISSDEGKFLEAATTTSVKWGEARPIPSGATSGQYLRAGLGDSAQWQAAESILPPAIPSAPKWLSQSSSSMEWRDIFVVPNRSSVPNGQSIYTNGTVASWGSATDIPIGPGEGAYDSEVRWVLTILDGTLAWRGFLWGKIEVDVGLGGVAIDHVEDQTLGIGFAGATGATGPAGLCFPDHSDAINTSALPIEDAQPHVCRSVMISVPHGMAMPVEAIDGVAFSPFATEEGSADDNIMSTVSVRMQESSMDILYNYCMGLNSTTITEQGEAQIYWAIWSNTVHVRQLVGGCHV